MNDEFDTLTVADLQQIDRICSTFEQSWKTTDGPSISSLLEGHDGAFRRKLLLELIQIDLEYRELEHVSWTADDYGAESPHDADIVAEAIRRFEEERDYDTSELTVQRAFSELPSYDAGAVFGNYELLEEIGHGGMGVIFKARHTKLGRIVAVKMIFNRSQHLDRFYREAEAAATLSHPHIVPIYEIGEHANCPFYTMRLIEGTDLNKKTRGKPLGSTLSAELTQKIAKAIDFAHQRGILHRDLKPANVMIDEDGDPHITDFGLAKMLSQDVSQLTGTGGPMGTPSYMAPEQALGQSDRMTIATDVYGIGAILYTTLTGQPPFAGATVAQTLRWVLDREPVAPSQIDPSISRDIETICLKCLNKDADKRYVSAKAVADDLERFLNREPIKARPVSTRERLVRWTLRNPVIATLAVSILMLLTFSSVGGWWLWSNERETSVRLENEKSKRDEALKQVRNEKERAAAAAQAANVSAVELCLAFSERSALLGESAEAYRLASQAMFINQDESLKPTLRKRVSDAARRVARPIAMFANIMLPERKLQFDATGRYLIVRQHNNVLRITRWMIADVEARCLWPMPRQDSEITSATWSNAGRILAIGSRSGTVSLYDFTRGNRIAQFQVPGDGGVQVLQFSPLDDVLAVAVHDKIQFWDMRLRRVWSKAAAVKLPEKNEYFTPRVYGIAFNDGGTRVAISSRPARNQGRTHLFDIDRDADTVSEQLSEVPHRLVPDPVEGIPRYATQFVHGNDFLIASDSTTLELYDGDLQTKATYRVKHPIWSVARSINGLHIMVGGRAGVQVLSHELKEQAVIPHDKYVTSGEFNRRSNLVVSGAWDRTVRVSRVSDGRLICEIPHQTWVRQVAFSNAGTVATLQGEQPTDSSRYLQYSGLLRIWKVPAIHSDLTRVRVNGTRRGHAQFHPSEPWIIYSPFPRRGWKYSRAWLFHRTTRKLVEIDSPYSIIEAKYFGDDEILVLSRTNKDKDGKRHLHLNKRRLSNPKSTGSLTLADDYASLSIDQATGKVAVVKISGHVDIIDGNKMKLLTTYESSRRRYGSSLPNEGGALFGNNATKLFLFGFGSSNNVFVWQNDQRIAKTAIHHRAQIVDAAISPDGSLLATAGFGHQAKLWNVRTNRIVHALNGHQERVLGVRFSSNSKFVITSGRDNQALIFDVDTGRQVGSSFTHPHEVHDAVMSHNGRLLFTLSEDQRLRVWHIKLGQVIGRPIELEGIGWRIDQSSDGRFLVVSGATSGFYLLDVDKYLADDQRASEQLVAEAELGAGRIAREQSHLSVPLSTGQWTQRFRDYERTFLQESDDPPARLLTRPRPLRTQLEEVGLRYLLLAYWTNRVGLRLRGIAERSIWNTRSE